MFGRRRVRRVTVNIPAWIEVGDSTLLERCTLVDLTDEGAKLVVGDISHLTDHCTGACLLRPSTGGAADISTEKLRPPKQSVLILPAKGANCVKPIEIG